MPLYTFKCKKCKVEFDQKQSLEEFDQGLLPEHECSDGSRSESERIISLLKSVSSTWAYWRR